MMKKKYLSYRFNRLRGDGIFLSQGTDTTAFRRKNRSYGRCQPECECDGS